MKHLLLIPLFVFAAATTAKAADYYQEQQYVVTQPSYQHREETVVTGAPPPPPPPQVVYVQRPRVWNPIGAIMAVPRAALAVPGRILGGDDEVDE